MSKAIFTVPSDFKVKSLQEIIHNNISYDIKVKEVYGSFRDSKYGSGRKYFELPTATEAQCDEYFSFCKRNGINFNYTLNSSCYSNIEFNSHERKDFIQFVSNLVQKGITQFTVALPSVIDLLYKEFPHVKVTLSIITGVDSLSKMRTFCAYENINSIYLHERIFRQFSLVKQLCDLAHYNAKKVGVIANSFCLSDCPYRPYHYNFGAHAIVGSEYIIPEYYGTKCALLKFNDLRNVLNAPWIRPEDIDKYIDIGIDRFKISGREMHNNNANINEVIKIYNDRHYDGNLVSLFMCFTKCAYSDMFEIKSTEPLEEYLDNVFRGKWKCNKDGCTDCNLCREALKAITVKESAAEWVNTFNDRLIKFKGL